MEETQADEVIAFTNTFDPFDRRASYRRLAAAVGLKPHPGRPAPATLPGWGPKTNPAGATERLSRGHAGC